jgi:hypothetical protein
MTTSDHPMDHAPVAPVDVAPVDEVPVGALGGFPPPPPVEDDGPGDAAAATGTNTMAVLGLVFAFLLPVLGLVFSAVGLVQTRRRGQDGRGLAVAGLAVSVALLVVAAVLLATVGTTARRTAGSPQDAVPAAAAGTDAPPVPAGNPADEAVVAACSTILPAVAQLQTDLGGAATVDDVATRIAALQRQIAAAAAGTGDGGFTAHAGALAADFGRLVDAARGGGDPAALVGSIQQDGMELGQDCGQAGWLP